MKFYLVLIFSFILTVLSTFSQIRSISNAQYKTISEREFNKTLQIKTQYFALIPNKNSSFSEGKLTKVNYFEKDGKLVYSSDYETYSDSMGTVYYYYQDGYLQSLKRIASESNQLLVTYNYDSTGKIIKLVNSGSEYKEYECYYDSKGNLVKKLGYIYYPKTDDSGFVKPNYHEKLLADEYYLKYDKSNNITEEKTKLNGRLINLAKYKYNKQNLKQEETNFYLGNKVRYIYLYDDTFKLTDITRVNIDGSKSFFKVEYEYYD